MATSCISCVEYLCGYLCSQWHTLFVVPMKEFDYSLDYKNTLFEPNDPRYRIGRGEQGVLLIRPYTDDICQYWRFKTIEEARVSSQRIYDLYTGSFATSLRICRKIIAEIAFSLVLQSFSCGFTLPSASYFLPSA